MIVDSGFQCLVNIRKLVQDLRFKQLEWDYKVCLESAIKVANGRLEETGYNYRLFIVED
jgi:hypothetical protein